MIFCSLAPVVKRLPYENRIVQGKDFSISCEASGSPQPTIKWTKVHESLADNVHVTGNVLRIINARPENRGMYVCIAENSAGSDQSNTIIDIERKYAGKNSLFINAHFCVARLRINYKIIENIPGFLIF